LNPTITVWDTYLDVGKTGDAGNITWRVIKDGVSGVRSSAGAVTEPDSTYAPGEYKVPLDATDMNADVVEVVGTSTTAGVQVRTLKIVTEQGTVAAVKTDTAAILLDTGTDGVKLADDAITASKFDETTAFPQTAADVGGMVLP